MEAAAQKSRSATVLDLQVWTYYDLYQTTSWGTYYPIYMFLTNSGCLIGISDAFSAFCLRVSVIFPRAHYTPNKSVPTLRYTRC